MTYRTRLHTLLSPAEHRVFKKLSTPGRIQNYLDALPQNFSTSRVGSCRSPRRVLKDPSAYCLEGAVFAAAALAYHGLPPLLLDIKTTEKDEEHVVALFSVQDRSQPKVGGPGAHASGGKVKKWWGAISKTNYPVLRWRDPIYRSVRELAMSYFHEYFLWQNGAKTMRAYSKPLDLTRYAPERWVVSEEPLEWLAEVLDKAPHFPVAPQKTIKTKLRNVSMIERVVMDLAEWNKKGKKIDYY